MTRGQRTEPRAGGPRHGESGRRYAGITNPKPGTRLGAPRAALSRATACHSRQVRPESALCACPWPADRHHRREQGRHRDGGGLIAEKGAGAGCDADDPPRGSVMDEVCGRQKRPHGSECRPRRAPRQSPQRRPRQTRRRPGCGRATQPIASDENGTTVTMLHLTAAKAVSAGLGRAPVIDGRARSSRQGCSAARRSARRTTTSGVSEA
jgi:hypothetical protein